MTHLFIRLVKESKNNMRLISFSILGLFLLLVLNNNLIGQSDQYLLSFDNQQTSGGQLCVDVTMGFRQAGKLGSSNLVLEFNQEQLANPSFISDELPDANYLISSFTNPVDSLASFNIELLSENNGLSISETSSNTKIGEICFDQLGGFGPIVLDWVVKNTHKTVVYLDDESTILQNGPLEVLCNNSGQTCDDGDPNTILDKYDVNCLCTGIQQDCINDLAVDTEGIPARIYKSNNIIESEGLVRNRAVVEFKATTSIILNAGFYAEEGSVFVAMIENCTDNLLPDTVPSIIAPKSKLTATSTTALSIYPNPVFSEATISYTLSSNQQVEMGLYNLQGQKVQQLLTTNSSAGVHVFNWQVKKLIPGMYFIQMKTGQENLVQKIIIKKRY